MTFVDTIPDEKASGAVADAYRADEARLGYVANYTRVFVHRPTVYDAWQKLNGAIRGGMDLRRYELVTVAAAQRLRSSYCSLAHGKVLVDQFFGASEVRDVLLDRHAAGLTEVDIAVMDLAEKLVEDATSITQSDIDHLRDLGLSDTDIFDVVVAAGARCFFSKTLDALGVQADAAYAELEPSLRDALTIGRPIATQ
jgi:uncharacterized peroxidase-related enzyme